MWWDGGWAGDNLITSIITPDIAPREPSARRGFRSYPAGSGCPRAFEQSTHPSWHPDVSAIGRGVTDCKDMHVVYRKGGGMLAGAVVTDPYICPIYIPITCQELRILLGIVVKLRLMGYGWHNRGAMERWWDGVGEIAIYLCVCPIYKLVALYWEVVSVGIGWGINMPPRHHNGDDTNSGETNGSANSGIQELANLISGLVNQLTQANQSLAQNRGGANPPTCTFKHFNSCNPQKFTGAE
ncbi:hypothetical protein E3N88_32316 [Mikania micrantha]|uniref:Uncharacterized protein n=1 Tax=Mikania micrantha TaxID=192012 RepID=A0A5N6M8N0_9ASTR|nr:hypothetical protein E3N88_32316 [Mikania micrantha]